MQAKHTLSGLTALTLLGCLSIGPAAHAAPVFDDLFSFGDSYSDTGASFPLTNGSTAVGYLAKDLGITLTTSKNPHPGTDGVNFAESGATVGSTPASGRPRSLLDQVTEFKNYVTTGALTFNPATSLFFLSGGLNDHTTPLQTIINAYTSEVNTLISLGARHIEIALIPSKVPAFADSASRLNPLYLALVPQLQSAHPDVDINLSNWGPFYDDILVNPAKYGITNTTDPCFDFRTTPFTQICSTPDQYFYGVVVHPSDAAHHIVGDELFQEALLDAPEPTTMALLATGLFGLALRRRTAA
jgi:phospholipase/lecithinase/hemolysin